ncbi:MAG: hypothetical protein VB071_05340 [Lawsonibacter sp.]|nr:hypothetical protein [Lawsonibacter sp.]
MRNNSLLSGLAVVGGGLGFGLRLWQWTASYDPDTQLFTHGHPSIFLLTILTAVLILIFLLILRPAHGSGDPLSAFRCPSTLYMTGMTASALLFMGAGVLGILEGTAQLALWRADSETNLLTYPIALILGALFSFAAGPATLIVGKGAYGGTFAPSCSLLAVFPPLSALAWLFATHLAHGTDPVLMDYCFSLAAIAALLLAQYYVAAFFHDHPHPRAAAFWSLMGVFLALISFADGLSPFKMMLTAAFTLSSLSGSWALLRNLFGPPWPKRLLDARMPLGTQEQETPEQPE